MNRKEENIKVALIQDFLNQFGGAEAVLKNIHDIYPNSDVYTLYFDKDKLPSFFKDWNIYQPRESSWLPLKDKLYKFYLPLYPTIVEQIDIMEYDLVISSSYLFAKGVITSPDTTHICYCHTPFRQAWELYHYYKKIRGQGIFRWFYPFLFNYLRLWDRLAADRVDYFLTNSKNVKRRIKKYYGSNSTVIYPPVNTDKFYISEEKKEYFLCLSRLVPYKSIDIVVKAFQTLDEKLLVAGKGPELKKLRRISTDNVTFLEYVTEKEKKKLFANCKALIFPGYEDFGIVPVEAMASGRPVLGYYKGGIRETVERGLSGLFFKSQSPSAVKKTIKKYYSHDWSSREIKKRASKFDTEHFKRKFKEYVSNLNVTNEQI